MLRTAFRAGLRRSALLATAAPKQTTALTTGVRHAGGGGAGGYGSGPYRGVKIPKVAEWHKNIGTIYGTIMWLWLFWRAKHDGKAFLVPHPPVEPARTPHATMPCDTHPSPPSRQPTGEQHHKLVCTLLVAPPPHQPLRHLSCACSSALEWLAFGSASKPPCYVRAWSTRGTMVMDMETTMATGMATRALLLGPSRICI